MAKTDIGDVQKRAKDAYSRNLASTETDLAGLRGSLGESKSRTSALFGQVMPGLLDASATGGYDPGMLSAIRSSGMTMADTGGFDQGRIGDVRNLFGSAGAGFGEMAQTGGISESDADAMRRAATRGVTSTYDVLSNEANRRRAVTGGYGGTGEISQMARQVGQKAAEATTDVNARIAGLQQTGRLAGLGGLTSTAGAAGGFESGLAAGRRSGTQLLAQIESDVASGRRASLGGLTQLYNITDQEAQDLGHQILQRIQLGNQASSTDMQIMTELAKAKPGLFSSIMGGLGSIASFASTVAP